MWHFKSYLYLYRAGTLEAKISFILARFHYTYHGNASSWFWPVSGVIGGQPVPGWLSCHSYCHNLHKQPWHMYITVKNPWLLDYCCYCCLLLFTTCVYRFFMTALMCACLFCCCCFFSDPSERVLGKLVKLCTCNLFCLIKWKFAMGILPATNNTLWILNNK